MNAEILKSIKSSFNFITSKLDGETFFKDDIKIITVNKDSICVYFSNDGNGVGIKCQRGDTYKDYISVPCSTLKNTVEACDVEIEGLDKKHFNGGTNNDLLFFYVESLLELIFPEGLL